MEQVMTENGSLWEKNRVWLLAAFLGMITFICIYGIRILDFTYDDWLLNGGGICLSIIWAGVFSETVTGVSRQD